MKLWTVVPVVWLGIARAQSAGTFTPTGSMAVPRQFHTASLLPDGKVLIAGGISFGNGPTSTWSSAEIYDPSTGTSTSTGDMTSPRARHTATLLPNGQVLIVGGSTTDLYDPAMGAFHAAGRTIVPRSGHTATLLNNGEVLIAGGSSGVSAELYDPATGTFTPTGDMTEPGADTATLLPNGKVLITRSTQLFEENHADIYDPATGTFSRTGDLIDASTSDHYLAIPGQNPSAILLTNGKVLVAGGAHGDFLSDSAEIYDAAAGVFSVTGTMTAPIGYWQAAVLLPEGKVLIAGESPDVPCGMIMIGFPSTGTCPGYAELYDSVTGTFSGPMVSLAEEGHAATLLPDGTVLLSGGFRCCGITIAGAEIYHPAVPRPSPVLLSLSGSTQGAILHASTQQLVSRDNPAVAGEVIEIYGTGLIDDAVIPPQVSIGGLMTKVLYFGPAPGYTGLKQINVRVPPAVGSGPAIEVRLTYLARPSNEVTIQVQ